MNANKKKIKEQCNTIKVKDVTVNIRSSFTQHKSISEALFTLAILHLKDKPA